MRVVVVLCFVLAVTACQPAGGPGAGGPAVPSDDATGLPLGAPAGGLPTTLQELFNRADRIAEEWQVEPVLVEVEVDVEGGRWRDARLVYVAADADRYLQLTATGSGFAQERITLSTLQVEPIPSEAVAEIPAFPDDAAQPAQLAAAEGPAQCGVGDVASVFYVTGAPVAWNGTEWTPAPQWRATVTAPDGSGAAIAVSGGAGECLD